jgi:glycerophosphoryl diester phosphodiesterase
MAGFGIVAHRGASAYAPEHSFAAYDLALAQDAQTLELDVRASTDGVLFVLHDATLDTQRSRGVRTSARHGVDELITRRTRCRSRRGGRGGLSACQPRSSRLSSPPYEASLADAAATARPTVASEAAVICRPRPARGSTRVIPGATDRCAGGAQPIRGGAVSTTELRSDVHSTAAAGAAARAVSLFLLQIFGSGRD